MARELISSLSKPKPGSIKTINASTINAELIEHIHGSQCGNLIGAKFWEAVYDEHDIDPTRIYHDTSDLQLERVNVYLNEVICGRFSPHAMLMDMDG